MNRNRVLKTKYSGDKPYYEARCDEKGLVWISIGYQTFRLAYDPIEAEQIEQIDGYGKKHGEWLAKQAQAALDNLAFAYEDIKTAVQ